jgi:hypothetical protein
MYRSAGLGKLRPTKKGSVEGAHCIIGADKLVSFLTRNFEVVSITDEALIQSSLDIHENPKSSQTVRASSLVHALWACMVEDTVRTAFSESREN